MAAPLYLNVFNDVLVRHPLSVLVQVFLGMMGTWLFAADDTVGENDEKYDHFKVTLTYKRPAEK